MGARLSPHSLLRLSVLIYVVRMALIQQEGQRWPAWYPVNTFTFRASLHVTTLPYDNTLSSNSTHLLLFTTRVLRLEKVAPFCIYPHTYSYLLRVGYGHVAETYTRWVFVSSVYITNCYLAYRALDECKMVESKGALDQFCLTRVRRSIKLAVEKEWNREKNSRNFWARWNVHAHVYVCARMRAHTHTHTHRSDKRK